MTFRVGQAHRASLGVLLFAGVLSPVAAEVLGWASYPRPTVPAAVTVALVLAAVVGRASGYAAAPRAAFAAVTFALATWFAAVLREETNTFYTPTALFGGMVVLLFLHAAAVAMREIVIRDDDAPRIVPVTALPPDLVVVAPLERLPPNEIRVVRAGHAAVDPAPRDTGWRGNAALSVDDALVKAAAWLLLLFWGLVALEHRHVASACILLAGVLLAGRCLVLLPGVLATRGDGAATRA